MRPLFSGGGGVTRSYHLQMGNIRTDLGFACNRAPTFDAVSEVQLREKRRKGSACSSAPWRLCLLSKPCFLQLLFSLQQALMFCPIFPTIPPYIRPVISWVVTVRVHGASAPSLLHQPTKWDARRGKSCSSFHWAIGVRGEGPKVREGGRSVHFKRGQGYHVPGVWRCLRSRATKRIKKNTSRR